MKKGISLALALLLLLSLAACGGQKKEVKSVNLDEFYSKLADQFKWGKDDMVDLTDDLLGSYYPGLQKLSPKQMMAKVPKMASSVNELVFVECKNADDAKKAEKIFQKRIDDQQESGALYPESLAAWKKAKVCKEGNYVAMIASAKQQEKIVKNFTALFA